MQRGGQLGPMSLRHATMGLTLFLLLFFVLFFGVVEPCKWRNIFCMDRGGGGSGQSSVVVMLPGRCLPCALQLQLAALQVNLEGSAKNTAANHITYCPLLQLLLLLFPFSAAPSAQLIIGSVKHSCKRAYR